VKREEKRRHEDTEREEEAKSVREGGKERIGRERKREDGEKK